MSWKGSIRTSLSGRDCSASRVRARMNVQAPTDCGACQEGFSSEWRWAGGEFRAVGSPAECAKRTPSAPSHRPATFAAVLRPAGPALCRV